MNSNPCKRGVRGHSSKKYLVNVKKIIRKKKLKKEKKVKKKITIKEKQDKSRKHQVSSIKYQASRNGIIIKFQRISNSNGIANEDTGECVKGISKQMYKRGKCSTQSERRRGDPYPRTGEPVTDSKGNEAKVSFRFRFRKGEEGKKSKRRKKDC